METLEVLPHIHREREHGRRWARPFRWSWLALLFTVTVRRHGGNDGRKVFWGERKNGRKTAHDDVQNSRRKACIPRPLKLMTMVFPPRFAMLPLRGTTSLSPWELWGQCRLSPRAKKRTV